MKFFYKRYAPGLFRPVIPIEIKANTKSVRYEALIDSGADLCIFDGQIAQVLGISVRKGQKRFVGGITGTERPFFVHPVLILIGGWDYEIAAGFMPDLPPFGYGVLGQKGFFEHFIVKFDYSKAEIEVRPKLSN
ncbi:hypothetical protein A3H89_04290 [Candidatus Amesbacteria bacterium RIFCSPLOWO2_02_FULL_48_11]|uniref:Peptidase A2 domain-containing protein n=3 Tax=Candidatus Amesiibacteriota TaxID=1752730 RepID=A0A1F4Z6R5_9BACT|nr:MAG: hypothetical protein UX78_C0015G0005 [Candidatus Amesbacteria bacterium GW2011_GWA2_47_11]KKU99726.1 MAG: hypothetical protein UY33_C0024G0031 [Candidatus Amesbacteria bacterium GW2011_GWA1_48_9]OGC91373.1 MAG: hypothetical protein A2V48_00075 [Candidatus Amesbacteria bacterium RBG_19FT_COMBO_48_16]OGC95263.1 MAG: hypothetical protein A3C34_03740 [Candidatus Amesbacteria bacterium RIFCSPHIGHO2_02_FULL_48_21]OGC98974.1 MAG: hypothetical protein A2702_00355 [Candidatus Amesbacteria bacter